MYFIRYALARPVLPGTPKILKNQKVSSDKRQDITAQSYAEACTSADQEVNQETYEHLKERDKYAWSYRMDFPITEEDVESITNELVWAPRAMRRNRSVPGRNPFGCRNPNCDWLDLCHANPDGNIEEWWGTVDSDYDGIQSFRLKDTHGRKAPNKILTREKPGSSVSPSELRTYMRCQRKWWFEYVKRKKIDKSYSHYSARLKGTFCHLAAELIGKAAMKTPRELWDTLKNEPLLLRKYTEQAQELLGNFSEEDKATAMKDIWNGWCVGHELFRIGMEGLTGILHIEERFAFLWPGTKTWMTCKPDLVAHDEWGNIYIVDYKTTSNAKLNQVAEGFRYNAAPYFYAGALEHGYLLEKCDA